MPRGRSKKDKTLELATLVQENTDISQQEVEILPAEQVEIMSLSQIQQAKLELAQRRQKVMLMVDKNKMEQILKIMDVMADILTDNANGTKEGTLTPMDRKFLSESYNKWLDSLNKISRLDSVDGSGKSGRLSLKIEFEV